MNKGSSTEYFATVSADFMNKALPTFVHGECIRVHFPAGAIRNRLHCRPTQNLTTFGIGKTHFAPNASKSTLTKKRERFMKLHRPVPLVFCTCHKTNYFDCAAFHSDSPWVNQSGAALLLFHFQFNQKSRILRIKGREGDEKTRARLTLEPAHPRLHR